MIWGLILLELDRKFKFSVVPKMLSICICLSVFLSVCFGSLLLSLHCCTYHQRKENSLQDLLEAKTTTLLQSDRLLAQFRLRIAQCEAEVQITLMQLTQHWAQNVHQYVRHQICKIGCELLTKAVNLKVLKMRGTGGTSPLALTFNDIPSVTYFEVVSFLYHTVHKSSQKQFSLTSFFLNMSYWSCFWSTFNC